MTLRQLFKTETLLYFLSLSVNVSTMNDVEIKTEIVDSFYYQIEPDVMNHE